VLADKHLYGADGHPGFVRAVCEEGSVGRLTVGLTDAKPVSSSALGGAVEADDALLDAII
jgi:hypothetical protein